MSRTIYPPQQMRFRFQALALALAYGINTQLLPVRCWVGDGGGGPCQTSMQHAIAQAASAHAHLI